MLRYNFSHFVRKITQHERVWISCILLIWWFPTIHTHPKNLLFHSDKQIPLTIVPYVNMMIASDSGFVLVDIERGTKKISHAQRMIVTMHEDAIFINGKKLVSELMLFAPSGVFAINNQQYQGYLIISPTTKRAYVQNLFHSDVYNQIIKNDLEMRLAATLLSPSKHMVRVLLAHYEPMQTWKLYAEGGLVIYDAQLRRCAECPQEIEIKYVHDALIINQQSLAPSRYYIVSKNAHIRFNDTYYQGVFILEPYEQQLLLINYLDLEDYVYSVVKSEGWPGWPVEINKVLAIVCRSYALAKIRETHKHNRPYHLMNTNIHQTYRGMHTTNSIKEAVEQTKHIFLAYDKKPIIAMFDSCCGGIIPAHVANAHVAKIPYLARSYPCTFCKRCKIYNWHATYSMKELERIVEIPYLKQIKISAKDKAGLVRSITCKGKRKQKVMNAKILYSSLKGIKSFCYSVRIRGDQALFTGRGYGHHLGLCQWGAREMVRDGWNYQRILQFYYPGTELMQLV